MPSPALLAVFALATFVLTATPGPGVLYVVGRSVGGGRRSGLASMLGIETGEAVYIAGAALGIRAWRQDAEQAEGGDEAGARAARRGLWGAYGRGLVVQLLNPKVAVFFLAYFPQFVRPGQPVAPQVALLGAIYLAIAVGTDACYVLLASWLADRLARTTRARRRRSRFSALMYFALAAAALLVGDRGAAARAVGQAT